MRGADFFDVTVQPFPGNEANCERNFSRLLPSVVVLTDIQSTPGSGQRATQTMCIPSCDNVPAHAVTPAEASGGSIFFRVPALPNLALQLVIGNQGIDQ